MAKPADELLQTARAMKKSTTIADRRLIVATKRNDTSESKMAYIVQPMATTIRQSSSNKGKNNRSATANGRPINRPCEWRMSLTAIKPSIVVPNGAIKPSGNKIKLATRNHKFPLLSNCSSLTEFELSVVGTEVRFVETVIKANANTKKRGAQNAPIIAFREYRGVLSRLVLFEPVLKSSLSVS